MCLTSGRVRPKSVDVALEVAEIAQTNRLPVRALSAHFKTEFRTTCSKSSHPAAARALRRYFTGSILVRDWYYTDTIVARGCC